MLFMTPNWGVNSHCQMTPIETSEIIKGKIINVLNILCPNMSRFSSKAIIKPMINEPLNENTTKIKERSRLVRNKGSFNTKI